MLKTVKVRRITEEIVTQIKEHISNGELKTGDRLPSEREMAQQLGVGRPAVREALQILEHTGIIRIVRGSGTFINDLGKQTLTDPLQVLLGESNDNYIQLYEFRIAIESWAVSLAAQMANQDDISRLSRIIEHMEDNLTTNQPMYKLDIDFHLAIAQASHNKIYYQVAHTIMDLLSQATQISHKELFSSPEDQVRIVAEHKAIFQAIKDRESNKIGDLMRRHLDHAVKILVAGTGSNFDAD